MKTKASYTTKDGRKMHIVKSEAQLGAAYYISGRKIGETIRTGINDGKGCGDSSMTLTKIYFGQEVVDYIKKNLA